MFDPSMAPTEGISMLQCQISYYCLLHVIANAATLIPFVYPSSCNIQQETTATLSTTETNA